MLNTIMVHSIDFTVTSILIIGGIHYGLLKPVLEYLKYRVDKAYETERYRIDKQSPEGGG